MRRSVGHGGVVLIAELGVEGVEDRQRRVEADEVEERQRAHREVAAALHRGVDVLARGGAVLQHAHGVVEVREQQGVDDEAGAVGDLDGVLAAGRGERHRRLDRVVAGGERADDLDELHQRRRVEEVDAADPVRALGGDRHLDDGQRRGVGGEDAVGLDDLLQLGEQLALGGEVLDDALDHEVAVGEPAEVVGGGDAGERGVAVGLLELALGHLPVEVAGHAGHDGLGALLAARSHDHVEAGAGGHLDQPRAHDPRADDPHRVDVTHAGAL